MKINNLQAIRLSIMTFIGLGVALQIFSALVSYHTVSEFLGAYITFYPVQITFSFLTVLAIEVLIRVFSHTAVLDYESYAPNIVLMVFAIFFIVLSMYLTTVSPARIVVKNIDYVQEVQRPERDLAILEAAVTEDLRALTLLNEAVAKRKGAWITREERAEKAALNDRIAANQAIIQNEMAERRAENEKVKSLNSTIRQEAENTHNSFGFLSQVFLVFTVIAIRILQKEKEKIELENLGKKTVEKYKENGKKAVGKYKENGGENEGKTVGKHVEKEKENENEETEKKISVNEGTSESILKMTLQGFSTQEIMEKLKLKTPSTITKVRQNYILEMCKDGTINANNKKEVEEALEKMGLSEKPFKDLRRLQSIKHRNLFSA